MYIYNINNFPSMRKGIFTKINRVENPLFKRGLIFYHKVIIPRSKIINRDHLSILDSLSKIKLIITQISTNMNTHRHHPNQTTLYYSCASFCLVPRAFRYDLKFCAPLANVRLIAHLWIFKSTDASRHKTSILEANSVKQQQQKKYENLPKCILPMMLTNGE